MHWIGLARTAIPGLRYPYNFELVGVVFVEKSDWHTHHAVVVAGDCVGVWHFDRVVVVVPVVTRLAFDLFVLAEPQVVLHGHKWQLLMASPMVQVGEPDCWHVDQLDAVDRLFVFPLVIGDKPHSAGER